jgi:hypothetical protein
MEISNIHGIEKKSIFLDIHIIQIKLKFQCNPYQNTSGILHRTRKNNPKTVNGTTKCQILKAILSKRNKAGYITPPDLKISYTILVVKIV